MKISLLFPAYNEGATVADVLRSADEVAKRTGCDYEILACDDGSKDNTLQQLNASAESLPELRVIGHEKNQGLFRTFQDLYSEATGDYLFLNATDGQWPNDVLFKLLPLAKPDTILIAARHNKNYRVERTFVSWSYNTLAHLLFRVNTVDAGAVKLIPKAALNGFVPISHSPFADCELLIKAARAGMKIVPVFVETRKRAAGKSSIRFPVVWDSFVDMLRVWWKLEVAK